MAELHVRIGLSFLAIAGSLPMFSQESIDSLVLSDVTVTARRPTTKITSGTPVQMLYTDNLAAIGVNDLADAVRRFAGVNVKDYGGMGGLKTVSVRNMGAAHTGVAYDGVPVSNCQGGQIDIGRFSLDNVEMLSLAVGQDSDPLQPARMYSSAAVLNITTARPSFTRGRNFGGRVEVKGGSFGYVNTSARWWQRFSDRWTGAVDGSFSRADGNYPYRLVNGSAVSTERRNNSDITSWQGEANLFYTPSDRTELKIKAYYYSSLRGLPGAVTLYNPVSTERLWDRNAFIQSVFTTRLSPKWRLRATAKYNYGFNRDREKGNQFEGGIYKSVHLQQEVMLSASAQYRPTGNLSVSAAQDGYYNTLSSTMGECPYPRRLTSLTALSARWTPGPLDLTATLVNTFITESVRSGERPGDIERLLPSVSVAYRPVSSEEFYVRAMYKDSFRAPSFNDLYYERLGNVNLRPERAKEYDFGLTYTRSLGSWLDYVTVTADAYYNTVRDKIVAFPSTYAWHMANYGRVTISGFDVTLAASVRLPRSINLSVTGSFTHQKALDKTSETTKNYGQQLPYTPRNSGNAGLTVSTPWLTVGYSLVGVGQKYYMSQNIPANLIKRYIEQNLTLSRELNFGKTTVTLRGELINFADAHYEVIKYYPMPGRSWRLTASVKF
ncbi:MAG: TonB-dependent receptor [Bacteroidales bacterium]|nr:TonB-dependent receptor [Bacteroidales bacterium]